MTSTIPDIRIADGLFVNGSGITKIDVDVLGEKIGGEEPHTLQISELND